MLVTPLNPDKRLKRERISLSTAQYSLGDTMKNVNRAERNANHAVDDDREHRGLGRKATVRRKKAARKAARRAGKAILSILSNDIREA